MTSFRGAPRVVERASGGSVEDVSDAIYEPMDGDDDDSEIIDQDGAFGEDDGGDDALDRGYSPPERPRELDAFETTVDEQRRGETLDQRLAPEKPDPALTDALEADFVDDGEV